MAKTKIKRRRVMRFTFASFGFTSIVVDLVLLFLFGKRGDAFFKVIWLVWRFEGRSFAILDHHHAAVAASVDGGGR